MNKSNEEGKLKRAFWAGETAHTKAGRLGSVCLEIAKSLEWLKYTSRLA